jgi:CDP-glucose 4,6-dehydratase
MTDTFWKGRPVFLTGATGFLGGRMLEQLLNEGAQVIALVREGKLPQHPNLQPVYGTLTDKSLVEDCVNRYDIETILHLGAQALVRPANRSPHTTFEDNIMGSVNILEAARTINTVKRTVIASSDKAYGDQLILPYTEKTPLQGGHPYDCSKTCVDLIAQCYARTYQLPVAITRCGNFYGPGDLHWDRIVPGTIRSLLNDERPIIRSDGKYIRDFLFVDDGVSAYLTLARNADRADVRGQAFNFSTGKPKNVLEIVETITKLCGKAIEPIVQNQASNEIREQYLDSSKARKVLGWTHQYELEDGIELAIPWYQQQLQGGAK